MLSSKQPIFEFRNITLLIEQDLQMGLGKLDEVSNFVYNEYLLQELQEFE